MRKKFVTLLLSLSAAALLANPVLAIDISGDDVGFKLMNANTSKSLFANPGLLGTSAGADPETIWVGFWPGANQANNYWKVGGLPGGPAGTGNRGGSTNGGVWTFEVDQHINGDSLSGWWSRRTQHLNASGAVRVDENRLWWGPEFGNIANHAGNPGGGTNRLFGVTGVWHRDAGANAVQSFIPGLTGANPQNPSWTPLGGGHSAWMGFRAHGDVTYNDPVTGNPFNGTLQDMLQYGGTTPTGTTIRRFPGYIGSMDQMLYRNVNMAGYAGGGMSVRFTYRTNMSTSKETVGAVRHGWFEGDWLSGNSPTPGNFISAEAGSPPNSEAPIDSFQVYIGAPVEGVWKSSLWPFDTDLQLQGLGIINANGYRIVQDPNRRWFNEVLVSNSTGTGVSGRARLWLFGAVGDNAPTTETIAISHANVQAMLDSAAANGQSGKLRLVFRVHTNRTFDDGAASVGGNYNSGYAGAAVIDDVQVDIGSGFVTIGDFEDPNSINNGLSADVAWHSTGKPPQAYFHAEDIIDQNLVYQDICGPVGGPNRICDLQGIIINMGVNDQNDAATNPSPLSSEHEGYWGITSPTINLAGADQNSKDPTKNNMNLSASERWATGDYYFYYEMYSGYFDVFAQGQIWQPAMQAYPHRQSDGVHAWSGTLTPGFLYFNPDKQCFSVADPGITDGFLTTSNVTGIPDSLRLVFQKISQCYRFGVTTGCSPLDGGYLDNMALMILDGVPQLIGVDIWDLFQDAFPANENPGLPGTAAFDTATAHIKIGLNTAPLTGNLFRYNIPGDSVTVQASGDSMRIDLLFRIKPGVGNYQTVGNQSSGLRDFGTGFFASYQANPGAFSGVAGSINPAAALAAHATAPSGWSELVWNSARMDTTEGGGHATFPVQAVNIQLPPSGGQWGSTYHETDLAGPRASLGIPRNRCFVIDTTVANLQLANVTCGDGTYPPTWVTTVPQSRTGWNGTTTTVEGTKIIPDGLLTPGAHVQYFMRRQDLANPTSVFAMVPDTNQVFPQGAEGNSDGHRWQHFAILPDRWKDAAFGKGGVGMACMLFVDNNDRRSNERVWKGVADSIGATSAAHGGAADGYYGVPGNGSVNDPAYFVNKNQQLGTLWDAYQVKASESLNSGAARIGGRLAYRAIAGTPIDGKWGRIAPTLDMLNTYYRMMLIVTGDLNSNIWGPFNDATDDDITTFQNWLSSGNTASPDRGILVIGESFVEAVAASGGARLAFVTDYLATTFQDPNYLLFVPDGRPYVDIQVASSVSPAGDIYGVNNTCLLTNDIIDVNAVVPNASINMEYVLPNQTLLPVGVTKAHDAANPWISQTISVSINSMRGRFGTTNGRLAWMYNTLSNVFGSLNCALVGSPINTTDTPNNGDGSLFVNFMNLKNNPLTSGYATVSFGLAQDDYVQVRVFDVSGRLVRTLADRKFKAGEHSLVWDGVDNVGRQLPRGVYFTQLKYRESGFELAKKLTILR